VELEQYIELFKNPTAIYRPQYFWFWNHDMESVEIRRQLRQMKEVGAGGAFIHARHMRITPYMSDEWLSLCADAIKYGKDLGLHIWLYDEDGFPSGFAQGKTVESNPTQFSANFLVIGEEFEVEPGDELNEEIKLEYPTSELYSIIAIPANPTKLGFELVDFPNAAIDLISLVKQDHIKWTAPDCPAEVWLVCPIVREWNQQAANVLDKAAMKRFIELTHDKYYDFLTQHGLEAEFGKMIPGIFTDEPGVMYCNGDKSWRRIVPYSIDLENEFNQKNKISLKLGILPVFFPLADNNINWRLDYWEAVATAYSEAYFRQIATWCSDHKIWLTGHLANDSCLFNQVRDQVNWFQMAQYMHLGPSDQLGAEFRPKFDQNYHLGSTDNMMTPRFAYSATRIYGKPRTISECFGSAKWNLSLEEQKALIDWQVSQGIDLFIPHDFIYSIEGARKRDHPPSFNTCAYFPELNTLNDYIGRLSALFGQPRQKGALTQPRIAVLYGNHTILANMNPMKEDAASAAHDAQAYLIDILQRLHRDFDIIPEDYFQNLQINPEILSDENNRYSLLILASCETIEFRTVEKIMNYAEAGGKILFIGKIPQRYYRAPKTNDELYTEFTSKIQQYDNVRILQTPQQPIWQNHLLYPIHELLNTWKLMNTGIRVLDPQTQMEIGEISTRYFQPDIKGVHAVGFLANMSENPYNIEVRMYPENTFQKPEFPKQKRILSYYILDPIAGGVIPFIPKVENGVIIINIRLQAYESVSYLLTSQPLNTQNFLITTNLVPQENLKAIQGKITPPFENVSVSVEMPPNTFNILNLNDWTVSYQAVKMGIERPSYIKYVLKHEIYFELDSIEMPARLQLILDGDITHTPRAIDGTLRSRPNQFNVFINEKMIQKFQPDTFLDHHMLQTENIIPFCKAGLNQIVVETFGGLSSRMYSLTEPVRIVGDFLAITSPKNESNKKKIWFLKKAKPINLTQDSGIDLSNHGFPTYPFPLDYEITFDIPQGHPILQANQQLWINLPKSHKPLYKIWLNGTLLGHVWFGNYEHHLREIKPGKNILKIRYFPFPDRLFENEPDYPLGMSQPIRFFTKSKS
jgi:hypothetical protein